MEIFLNWALYPTIILFIQFIIIIKLDIYTGLGNYFTRPSEHKGTELKDLSSIVSESIVLFIIITITTCLSIFAFYPN